MWQVLRLSPSLERARPYVEASEQKVRDVGFLERVSKQSIYILIRAFSKIRILS